MKNLLLGLLLAITTVMQGQQLPSSGHYVLAAYYEGTVYAMKAEKATTGNSAEKALQAHRIQKDSAGYWAIADALFIWKVNPPSDGKYSLQDLNGKYLTPGAGTVDLTLNSNKYAAWLYDPTLKFIKQGTRSAFFGMRDNKYFLFKNYAISNLGKSGYADSLLLIPLSDCLFKPTSITQTQLDRVLADPKLPQIDLRKINSWTNLTVPKPANPNCLVFVPESKALGKNEVVGDTCQALHFTDSYPVGIGGTFTAREAFYQRLAYQDGGWESLMLPYALETLPEGYEFARFSGVSEDGLSVTFTSVSRLEAHTPYLMRYTGEQQHNGSDTCRFSANDIAINAPVENALFRGVYTRTSAYGKYILSFKNGEVVFAKGDITAYVEPFRAYLDLTLEQAARMRIVHRPDATTEMRPVHTREGMRVYVEEQGALTVSCDRSVEVVIATVEGRIAGRFRMQPGEQRVAGLAPGFYLVNGMKIMIR